MELSDLIARPDRWGRLIGWSTAAGLICGAIGPFGSYPANSFTRIAYWILLFWAGTLILWPAVATALWLANRRRLPVRATVAAVALLACIPLAALAATAGHLFWPVHAAGMRALEWYGQTLLIALPAAAGALWLETVWHGVRRPVPDASGIAHAPADPPPPPETSASHVPAHLLETALCLQMEDHHVRLHGHGRSHLHLASLRDLVETLGEERGLQVHRSWWVARDAVRSWVEEDRSVSLLLVNGLRVPVARNRVATLRARGWLAQEAAGAPAR